MAPPPVSTIASIANLQVRNIPRPSIAITKAHVILPEVVDAVGPLPVLAAGGIGRGRQLADPVLDHVKEVRLSTRLTDSPACLITDTFGITPALARMYRASGQPVPVEKRILELNPNHPLVVGLRQAHSSRGADEELTGTAELLYGTALLAEGGVLEDPARFAGLLTERLTRSVGDLS